MSLPNFDHPSLQLNPEQTLINNVHTHSTNLKQEKSLNYLKDFSFDTYKLHQSYFTKQQLKEQQTYQVIQNQEFLYFGGIRNSMRHGWGVLINKNSIYEGEFSLNHKNGKGYIKYPNQSNYFGDFSNDKPNGHGFLQYESEYFIGDFQNGSMQGDGLWKNQKGQKYVGRWKLNKAHGYGIYVTQKSHYQGDFNCFDKHGYGIQIFANGDQYRGYYMHGKPHGKGQYFWQNGAKYVGNFKEGLRQGKGTWVSQNSDQYIGNFSADRKNGKGQFIWSNGNTYKGQFCQDMREGQGQMIWNDGSIYQGQWKRGLPNGRGVFKVKGEKPKYGIFQDNVLVSEEKQRANRNNHTLIRASRNKPVQNSFQKSKLFLNMIPQIPRRKTSKSYGRKTMSHNKSSTTGSTMMSFKIGTKKPITWRNL